MTTKTKILPILLSAAFCATSQLAHAAGGDLDTTFSGDGKQTVAWTGICNANDVAIQSDDKIVVIGDAATDAESNEFAIARFTVSGALDTPNFSGDGKQTVNFGAGRADVAQDVKIQSDGKIVVAGYSNHQFAVVRLNTDGSLDTSFSGDGKFLVTFPSGYSYPSCESVEIQGDGKIVLGGYIESSETNFPYRGVIVRLNSNGTMDTSFNADGIRFLGLGSTDNFEVADIALQSDGKIVFAGRREFTNEWVGRLTSTGGIDPGFTQVTIASTGSPLTSKSFEGVTVQSDGKILAVGQAKTTTNLTNFLAVRYNSNGSLDTSFSGNAIQQVNFGGSTNYATDVVLQPNGKIYIAGTVRDSSNNANFGLVRLTTSGDIDTTYTSDATGMVTTDFGSQEVAHGVARDSNGRIVVIGTTDVILNNGFAVARYGPLTTTPSPLNTTGSVKTF